MLRYLFSAILLVEFFPQLAPGAAIQLIDGLPSSYPPGQPVMFDVRLPAISNLGSYNIDLVLESSVGSAGVDFFFDLAATMPAAASHVFPSSANFFDAVNTDSSTRHRITVTDFDFAGVNVLPGTNDRVATVVFRTAPTFNQPLQLYVDAPLLILDTPDPVPTPIEGFEALQNDIAAASPIELPAVPEPLSLSLGASAFLTIFILGLRRRIRLVSTVHIAGQLQP